ncbi:diguanylate cyclase [Alteromonas oceani]|uniref:diguanylate cyclase n=1 Tax=Alteromonas oceani TaxID=2071609 RepID=A0ABV7K3F4_9ALTE|nr:diguanylate cyclase [Alteromonas oceani]
MNLLGEYTTFKEPQFQTKALTECKAVIVDDDKSSQLVLAAILQDIIITECSDNSLNMVEFCLESKPDVVLLDLNMPGKDGITVCRELKANKFTANIPVIFITGSGKPEDQDRCWEAGASDFIVKPVVASTLQHRVKNIVLSKLHLDLLTEQTFRDPLTGLYNRYYMNAEIPAIFKHCVREQVNFGVMMIDIDNFKSFNDTYGHLEGDNCLAQVASALKNTLRRPQDKILRYGGEEFAVFLPNTDREGVGQLAKAMCEKVESLNIENSNCGSGVITISLGFVVSKPDYQTSLAGLVNEADLALFEAKMAGKNQGVGHRL